MQIRTQKTPGASAVRADLKAKGMSSGDILLGDIRIGRFVTFGRLTGGRRATVYASRVYRGSTRIEEEAFSRETLLNKVAGRVSSAMRSGAWPVQANGEGGAAPSTEADEQPDRERARGQ